MFKSRMYRQKRSWNEEITLFDIFTNSKTCLRPKRILYICVIHIFILDNRRTNPSATEIASRIKKLDNFCKSFDILSYLDSK